MFGLVFKILFCGVFSSFSVPFSPVLLLNLLMNFITHAYYVYLYMYRRHSQIHQSTAREGKCEYFRFQSVC